MSAESRRIASACCSRPRPTRWYRRRFRLDRAGQSTLREPVRLCARGSDRLSDRAIGPRVRARRARGPARDEYFAHVRPSRRWARRVLRLRNDGTLFPVQISLSPLETPNGLVVSAAIRDISDRVETQRRLTELNGALANVLQRPDGGARTACRRARPLEPPLSRAVRLHRVPRPQVAHVWDRLACERLIEDQSERLDGAAAPTPPTARGSTPQHDRRGPRILARRDEAAPEGAARHPRAGRRSRRHPRPGCRVSKS